MGRRSIQRIRSIDARESDAVIRAGETMWMCQDWGCPARVSCGRHFGLSRHYAAMTVFPGALVTPSREGESCQHYRWTNKDHFATSVRGRRMVAPQVGAA